MSIKASDAARAARPCTERTTERNCLRDRTGNRRFWPVPVRNIINTGWVLCWRDQLFAGALLLYREGAPFAPAPQDEARLFKPMQESRLIDTAVQAELDVCLMRSIERGLHFFAALAH